MSHTHKTVQPGYRIGTVKSEDGEVLVPPADWEFLPAGDASITRSVKKKGETWVVKVQRGRRVISKGVWAKKKFIDEAKHEVEAKRSTPEYAKRRKADLARKEVKHEKYTSEFFAAVVNYLDFHPNYLNEAERIARLVTDHATPVGSGTVARTERIPLNSRAEAAVIAWMRHATTSYDSMKIPRIRGKRREVRRELSKKSIDLLKKYRDGEKITGTCPLQIALQQN